MVCPRILDVTLNVNKMYNLFWLALAGCHWFISIFSRHSAFYWKSTNLIGLPIVAYSLRECDRARKCYKLEESYFEFWLTEILNIVTLIRGLRSSRVSTKKIRLLALVFYLPAWRSLPVTKIALVYSNCQFDPSETFTSSLPVSIESKWIWATELGNFLICNHYVEFLIHRSQK